jgi:hypothetical protein
VVRRRFFSLAGTSSLVAADTAALATLDAGLVSLD